MNCIHDRVVCDECHPDVSIRRRAEQDRVLRAVEREEVETDLEQMRALVNELPTLKAAHTLIEAASRIVDVFTNDRIPMTRDQSLALLNLANAALHLQNLMP